MVLVNFTVVITKHVVSSPVSKMVSIILIEPDDDFPRLSGFLITW